MGAPPPAARHPPRGMRDARAPWSRGQGTGPIAQTRGGPKTTRRGPASVRRPRDGPPSPRRIGRQQASGTSPRRREEARGAGRAVLRSVGATDARVTQHRTLLSPLPAQSDSGARWGAAASITLRSAPWHPGLSGAPIWRTALASDHCPGRGCRACEACTCSRNADTMSSVAAKARAVRAIAGSGAAASSPPDRRVPRGFSPADPSTASPS